MQNFAKMILNKGRKINIDYVMVYVKPAMDGKLPAWMKRKNGRKLNKGDYKLRHIDL